MDDLKNKNCIENDQNVNVRLFHIKIMIKSLCFQRKQCNENAEKDEKIFSNAYY